jgi:hypothetical protein
MKSSQFTFNQNVEVMPSVGKVMLTVFRDSQKSGENVNSASYCEVVLKFRDAIRRKLPG